MNLEVPFNVTPVIGNELKFINEALQSKKLCGDGLFSKKCQSWFEEQTGALKTLMTPSCTAALELAALLTDLAPGDEVIMPSYTFVSTANAFALRGAKIVFVDIRPDTMNIDETKIEEAITERTKLIVPVHYAGVACEMDTIMALAEKYKLIVVEDAAQGVMSSYKGKPLGSIGHMAAFSFHETKNYTSGGEGGLLLINDKMFLERAEIIREKGTNRSLFFRGMVDKYSWVDIGSSFLPSEIQSAYLYGQLAFANEINDSRVDSWQYYNDQLAILRQQKKIELPNIPGDCKHNAHMFYIKTNSLEERTKLTKYLKERGIQTAFHYIPLHSSSAGKKYGFMKEDVFTTKESEKLLRLPLWYNMPKTQLKHVTDAILDFYS